MSETTDVYFDFLCPYAWRGLELADVLRREHGLGFTLRAFSLVQGNHADNTGRRNDPVWWLSDQPQGEGSPDQQQSPYQQESLAAFLADQAVARQAGQGEARWRYVLAVLRARHRDGQPLSSEVFRAAVTSADLDLARFEADLAAEPERRSELRADLAAAAEVGVFGTPTFALAPGQAAYFRFAQLVPGEQALATWQLYTAVLGSGAQIETVKRAKRA
jgi:2-hydroxychromene-2-carboxylate isomerase